MVFYAYITCIRDNTTNRLLFADAATADEWWRAVSAITHSIKRVNPQVYFLGDGRSSIYSFFFDVTAVSRKFHGRLITAPRSEPPGSFDVIPNGVNGSNPIDHGSGDWFYVRLKSDPSVYWYYPPEGNRVIASKTGRTLFRVVAPDLPEKTIMIGSDRIRLTIYPDIAVDVTDNGTLASSDFVDLWQSSKKPLFDFKFSSFALGRFVNADSNGMVYEDLDDGASKKPGWELVN